MVYKCIYKFILVNLYNSFTLIRTTLYVAHGQFVSLFNILDKVWFKHVYFKEAPISSIFKKKTITGENSFKYEISVLLEDGTIYNNIQKTIF